MKRVGFLGFSTALLTAMPISAQAEVMMCNMGGCGVSRSESCIVLNADGSRDTKQCSVHFSVKDRNGQRVLDLNTISLGEGDDGVSYKVRENAKFYTDRTFKRSGKTEDGYLCVADVRPNTSICIDAPQNSRQ